MNELIKITTNEAGEPTVLGRELHEFLGVTTRYNDWFPRMVEYGFTEGKDFNLLKNEQVRFEGNREVTRELIDHLLTIDMAKEICMIQRTEVGKQARQYFIQVEKNYNSPDGTQGSRVHTYWTQKGRIFLYGLLKEIGYLPLIERFKEEIA